LYFNTSFYAGIDMRNYEYIISTMTAERDISPSAVRTEQILGVVSQSGTRQILRQPLDSAPWENQAENKRDESIPIILFHRDVSVAIALMGRFIVDRTGVGSRKPEALKLFDLDLEGAKFRDSLRKRRFKPF
jgi:hypothetical protein